MTPISAQRLIIRLALASVLAACGAGDTGSDAVSTTSTTLTDGTPTSSLAPGSTQPTVEDTLEPTPSLVEQQAIADLAERLDAPTDEIKTVSVASGVWSDGSLGCPQPGMAYIQALVPGWRVFLEHDGISYSYHQGGAQQVFLCEDPAEDAFTGVEGDELIPPPGYDE